MTEIQSLYRTTDPLTSKQSAHQYDASGNRIRHIDLIRKALSRSFIPMTESEIAERTGLTHVQVARRGGDISRIANKSIDRECAILRRVCITWKLK